MKLWPNHKYCNITKNINHLNFNIFYNFLNRMINFKNFLLPLLKYGLNNGAALVVKVRINYKNPKNYIKGIFHIKLIGKPKMNIINVKGKLMTKFLNNS